MTVSVDDLPTVALVIPGRNCAATLDRCLQSVVPLRSLGFQPGEKAPPSDIASSAPGAAPSQAGSQGCVGRLQEIIFVDDGSTDATAEIAARYPVRVIQGTGQGPGAARNLGWRAAESDLIWFIDSDCVAEPDALEKLLPHMDDPNVAGVGGSYSNLYPDSLLATLIHEEIVARHRRMPREVNFLGGFNALYRRNVLEALEGYDESATNGPGAAGAEDCDLSFRAANTGMRLQFELNSRVGHHHPTSLFKYLRAQMRHGRFRVSLFLRHRNKVSGDSYAGLCDYLQPPLALLVCATLPVFIFHAGCVIHFCLVAILFLLQLPMAWRLIQQHGLNMLHFLWFGSIRAFARGIGLALGAVALVFGTLPAIGEAKVSIAEPKISSSGTYQK